MNLLIMGRKQARVSASGVGCWSGGPNSIRLETVRQVSGRRGKYISPMKGPAGIRKQIFGRVISQASEFSFKRNENNPLSGPTKQGCPSFFLILARNTAGLRVVPTPGSTTARKIEPAGKYAADCQKVTEPRAGRRQGVSRG
jgi:hypothetical protein